MALLQKQKQMPFNGKKIPIGMCLEKTKGTFRYCSLKKTTYFTYDKNYKSGKRNCSLEKITKKGWQFSFNREKTLLQMLLNHHVAFYNLIVDFHLNW